MPSRVSVVLVEVRCAERLASLPLHKVVRLLAGVACPAGVTVCEDCVVMPGTVGTLSPSDSDSVGPVGPVGMLYRSDSDSDSVGPVGPVGTLSPSDSVGPVGLDGTLSSSDPAGILLSAVPVRCAERLASLPLDKVVRLLAGVACPAGVTVCEDCVVMPGTVGTLSPSDFDSVVPVGPLSTWPRSVRV